MLAGFSSHVIAEANALRLSAPYAAFKDLLSTKVDIEVGSPRCLSNTCVRAQKADPSNPVAADEFRSDRDPIADLAQLIARGDASRERAAIDRRLRQENASEGRNETRGLPAPAQVLVDLNALEQALEQAYGLHECRRDETSDVDDPVDEEYKSKVPLARRRGRALVMAITGLALMGTAGVFDYRNMFGGSALPTLPPSINAINEPSTIASVNEPQAASSSDPRRADPATTGSIDNMVAQEGQPAAVAPSKTDPQASPPRGDRSAMRASGQAVPTQAVPRVAMATDPPAPPTTSHVLGSGYAVQLTSERTESRAQSAFRALQAKYPDQLNGRQAIIRRADLGAAGIYYRALVGPLTSATEATRLCSKLKAAGADCIIQKN